MRIQKKSQEKYLKKIRNNLQEEFVVKYPEKSVNQKRGISKRIFERFLGGIPNRISGYIPEVNSVFRKGFWVGNRNK